MSTRVHITGMGIISCIGDDLKQTLDALSKTRTGIGPLVNLSSIHKNSFVAGEVPHSTADLCDMAGIQAGRTTLLGMIAAREALQNAKINEVQNFRTGFISSTTVAGMPETELIYKDFINNKYKGDVINRHWPGPGTNLIAEELGITEFVTSISTACSSAANAIMLGARMIKNNKLDRVICGGSDALSIFTLNGFNSLMILDKDWCKPFDQKRKGLNLGEAAAYIVLESEEALKQQNKKSIALLSGYGNANDAFHQTASSPGGDGAVLAMKKALSLAALEPAAINYINAHGTGTPNNDSSECAAMQTVFGDRVPDYSSTKAYTGHTLAAAAGVEAVVSLLSLQNNLLFPTLNNSNKMEDSPLRPLTSLKKAETLQHIMSNSFGFGGNCSSLIFSREK